MKDKRVWAIVIVLIMCIVYMVPTVFDWESEWWPAQKINLGLDLQGGMHIVLAVDVDKAIKDELGHDAEVVQSVFKDRKLAYENAYYDAELGTLRVDFADAAALDKGREYLAAEWNDFEISSVGDLSLSLTMKEDVVRYIRQNALQQAVETISNRVDEFNVREPEIYTQGADQIVVRLPGVVDPARAKKLIGQTARLEFKLITEKARVAMNEQELLAPYGGKEPAGYKVYKSYESNKTTDRQPGRTNRTFTGVYLMRITPEITGANLIDARVGYDQYQSPAVNFTFNDEGARQFAEITGTHIGKQLAIILDDKVYSAPRIQSRIAGRGQITGDFTRQDALDLALVLRAGALPVPIRIDEERTVGATLGSDSIAKGRMSIIVGGVFVLLFMMFYYRKVGVAAVTALILNVMMILGGLALFGATLTLPGIAGMILTIGMAVDANVIINERVREELRNGKTPISAVATGYARATWTILDANITTLVAAVVLYNFGTGAIKGFAVTLTIGLIASVFTAIIVTRVIVERIAMRGGDRLSI